MRRFFLATLPVLVLGLCATSSWSAPIVLTFEGLACDTCQDPIPNGYGGFNWTNMYTINGSNQYANSGYENGVVSGVRTALNGFANPAATLAVAGDPFNFNGAYFTAAWNNGLSIRVEGYRLGLLQYSQTFTVNTAGPTFEALNYNNVDELRFSSFGGTQAPGLNGAGTHFAMDDFTFSRVPEPSTWFLCLCGLTGLPRRMRSTRRAGT